MKQRPALRARFWLEVLLAVLTGAAAIATIIWPAWIELVFGAEPDEGSGTVELAITVTIAIVSVFLSAAAGTEWRRGWRVAHE
jgi:hypothetical protein